MRLFGRPVFYGWVIVMGAWVLNMFNQAGFTWGFTQFVGPLQKQHGWSSTSITLVWACSLGWALLIGPWTGRFFDRFGPKALVLSGGIMAGAGWIIIPFVKNYWLFFFVFVFFVGTGLNATIGAAGTSTIAMWFKKHRSLAMGIYHTSSGGAGLLLIPLVGILVDKYGWRVGAITLGALIAVLCAALTPFFTQHPEQRGLRPDGETPTSTPARADKRPHRFLERLPLPRRLPPTVVDFTLSEALRTPAFWVFAIAIWLRYLGMGMSQVHLIPMMTSQGYSLALSTAVLSLSLTVNIPTRLLFGWLGDLYEHKWLLNICAVSGGVAMLALVVAKPSVPAVIWIFPILWGNSLAMLPLQGAWLADTYGRKHYGSISSTSNSITQSARIAGALLAATAFDLLGNYQMILLVGSVGFFVGAVMLTFLRAVSPPPRAETLRVPGPDLA